MKTDISKEVEIMRKAKYLKKIHITNLKAMMPNLIKAVFSILENNFKLKNLCLLLKI